MNVSSPERIAIYIDGGNLYQRLKDKEISFPKGIRFNYAAFCDFLLRGRVLLSKRYYIGIVRDTEHTAKGQEMVRNQQRFLSEIEKDGFSVKRGRIVYDGKVREKGVDVKLATDLVIGAVDNLYDTAIIVSSDTDLIPAIRYVKFKKKKVEYVGFSHSPSLGMTKIADLSILMLPEDVEKFKMQ